MSAVPIDASPAAVHGIVRSLPPGNGRCYLTFDDGPDPRWTPAMLELLARENVQATFFVLGQLALRHAALVREIRAAGHVVGNHSYSHRHPWLSSRARTRAEVCGGADAIADVLGVRPHWYRPPHGRMSTAVREAACDSGQRIALWNVSAVDWGPLASSRRIGARLRSLTAGDIVLMHDGPLRHNHPDQTFGALPDVLRTLAAHGPSPAPLPAPLQSRHE